MDPFPARCLHDHFRDLSDPRAAPAKRHDLLDIITITVCAVICGTDTWADVERFGISKVAWLRSFLTLPHSIPSHGYVRPRLRHAIPALLETLVVAGCVVTMDAMGCHQTIADQIVAQGADYVLAIKDNQPTLHELVADYFAQAPVPGTPPAPQVRTVEMDHGRPETRTCVVYDDPAMLRWLDPDDTWPGLRSIAMVTARPVGPVTP